MKWQLSFIYLFLWYFWLLVLSMPWFFSLFCCIVYLSVSKYLNKCSACRIKHWQRWRHFNTKTCLATLSATKKYHKSELNTYCSLCADRSVKQRERDSDSERDRSEKIEIRNKKLNEKRATNDKRTLELKKNYKSTIKRKIISSSISRTLSFNLNWGCNASFQIIDLMVYKQILKSPTNSVELFFIHIVFVTFFLSLFFFLESPINLIKS